MAMLLAVVFLGQGAIAGSILYAVHVDREGYPPLDTETPVYSNLAHDHEACGICGMLTTYSFADVFSDTGFQVFVWLVEHVYCSATVSLKSTVPSFHGARASPHFISFNTLMKGINNEAEAIPILDSVACLCFVRRCRCI